MRDISNKSQHPGVLLAGATGTIGRAVARELDARGFVSTALVRSAEQCALSELAGSNCRIVDWRDSARIQAIVDESCPAVVISCLASRSGAPKDAQAVDYAANSALLQAAERAGAKRFILLSAICVQRPLLAFQHAKLAFERELAESEIEYVIVRPTAFFKSLSGQVGRVAAGKSFLLFGDGRLTACKPISDADLARFLVDCIEAEDRAGAILPIGGPGPALSLRDAGHMLFEEAGREPKFRSVSPTVFRIAASILGVGAHWSDWLAEKAEYARIAHYYATQSMLVLDPESGEYSADATPEFGSETLREHYRRELLRLGAANRQNAEASQGRSPGKARV